MSTQRILAILGLILILFSLTLGGAQEIWVRLCGLICSFGAAILPLLARWGLVPPGMVNRKKDQ